MDSKNMSFEGFKFGELIKGNKEAIKVLISAIFGLWIPTDPGIKVVSGSLLKLLLDCIDFYASKVKLS